MTSRARSQRATIDRLGPWLPAGVALVGVVVRLRQYVASRSLWLDEVFLAKNFATRDLGELLGDTLGSAQSAPAGFIVAVEGVTSLFGTADPYLRLAPFVASLVFLAACVVLAHDWFSHLAGRLTFVVLAAGSPALVYYASEFKQYGVDAAVTAALLVCFNRVERRRGVALMAAAGAVAVWISLPAVFVIAGVGLALALEWIPERRWRDLVLLASVWTVSAAGMGAWSLSVGGSMDNLQAYWRRAFAPADIDRWYIDRLGGLVHVAIRSGSGPVAPQQLPAWTDPLNWTLLAACVVGLVCALRASASSTNRRAARALLIAGALTMGASAFDVYPFGSRLLLFLTPLVFLGLASLAERLGSSGSVKPAAWVIALCAVFLVAAPTVSILREPANRADTKGALAYVDRHGEPGDVFVVTAQGAPILSHYADRFTVAKPAIDSIGLNGAEAFLDRMASSRPGRTWVVVVHGFDRAQPDVAAIRRATTQLDAYEADRTGIYLFDFDDEFAEEWQRRG